jgi:hypothetical protein
VFWYQPGSTALAAAAWDPTRLVVHFADKEAIALHQITGDALDKLRGPTFVQTPRHGVLYLVGARRLAGTDQY